MKETTKSFTLMELFSIADGRLSNTDMESVYDVLNWVFDDNFTIIALPMAMNKLKKIDPEWFQDIKKDLQQIKDQIGTDNFEDMMSYIEKDNPEYNIPQLKATTI